MKKRTLVFWFACLTLGASAVSSAQEGDVKYRKSIMAAIGGHAGAIAEIAYGGVPYKDQLAGQTQALHALSTQITTAFKPQAMTEDPPTRAKPDIWEKWSEFEQKAGDLEQAAAALQEAAAANDEIAIASSLDPLWDACEGCHKAFRAKRSQ